MNLSEAEWIIKQLARKYSRNKTYEYKEMIQVGWEGYLLAQKRSPDMNKSYAYICIDGHMCRHVSHGTHWEQEFDEGNDFGQSTEHEMQDQLDYNTCVGVLSPKDKEFIELFYSDKYNRHKIELAKRYDMSLRTLYHEVDRILYLIKRDLKV